MISYCLSGCEKDDICAADTPTTPQVVIEFFDSATTASKAVTKLKIVEFGTSNILGIYDATSAKLPLKTDKNITKYSLILNSDKVAPFINMDNLEFNYTRNTVYISRACGYKTQFELTDNSPIKTDNTIPDNFWIKKITVATTKILDENETHIKIYF